MSKAYWYVTNDDKVFVRLRNVSMKKVHVGLQKTVVCTNKFGKRRQKCEHFCFVSGMWHQKLKIFMEIKFPCKVIMFEKNLELKNAIFIC
jgi:hypothetical protein